MNNRIAHYLSIVCWLILGSGCSAEPPVCAEVTDAQVCLANEGWADCDCDENALFFNDEGYVRLNDSNDNAYDTLSQLYEIELMLGIENAIEDEWLDGPTWSVHLFLFQSADTTYYGFCGWRVIGIFSEEGVPIGSKQITFWGMWLKADSPNMRPALVAYANAIELK